MLPFAVPLMGLPSTTPPPPPDPPPFQVGAGNYISQVSGASGTASGLCRAFPSNGVAPYSYAWELVSGSSPKISLGATGGVTLDAFWSDLTIGEAASAIIRITCTDATGAIVSNLTVPTLTRVS
jgi:hypothetical protein